MSENVYFEQGNVKVTSSRFVIADQTYPLGQITSVSLELIPKKTGCSTALMIGGGGLGAFVLLAFLASPMVGGPELVLAVLLIGVGVVGWVLNRQAHDSYAVKVTTAGGEHQLLKSATKEMPQAVVDALNQALVDRD